MDKEQKEVYQVGYQSLCAGYSHVDFPYVTALYTSISLDATSSRYDSPGRRVGIASVRIRPAVLLHVLRWRLWHRDTEWKRD